MIRSRSTDAARSTTFPRAAPPVPAPFVPRDAAEVGESRRGGDTESRRAPDAIDHDEDGVGDVVLRDDDAAPAAGGDDTRRAAAERVQRDGGRAAVIRPQAEPCGDERGCWAGVLAPHAVNPFPQSFRRARLASVPRARE